jgi:hypothetical protein
VEYLKLFKLLDTSGVRYLLCGGLAVNIYGIPRMTADIDIILDFEEVNLLKFEDITKLISYTAVLPFSIKQMVNKEVRSSFIKEKNLIAYSYFNNLKNVMSLDVLVDVPIPFNELWDKREVRTSFDFKINIVSINDLILLKKYSNRKQDNDDILLLSQLNNGK